MLKYEKKKKKNCKSINSQENIFLIFKVAYKLTLLYLQIMTTSRT